MKLLFFCGSLEPGRDGVGDYTRRLAGACSARGHTCAVIALHDPAVERVTDLTEAAGRHIRLPATEPWPDRLARARQHLESFAPDWVSWQIVVQGFQPRGFLPADLLQAAAHLRGSHCHVMLHELWLGLEAGSGWRARVLGWLQRRGLLCLLNQLVPELISTSNAAYQHALGREGFSADVLELFGNMPVSGGSCGCPRLLDRWLPGLKAPSLIGVTFGTLHPQWRPAATAEWLQATARRLGRTPALLALGRTGRHASRLLEAFTRVGIQVSVTGELEENVVSHLLQSADFGIAPHPWALIGKSGAAAAMLDHGLPVLVPRNDWRLRRAHPRDFPLTAEPRLTRLAGLDEAGTDRWLATRVAPVPALPRITRIFLSALNDAAAEPSL